MPLSDLSLEQLTALHAEQTQAYDALVQRGLKLDMTRGKPSSAELDLSNELLTLPGEGEFRTADGTDGQNYGPPAMLAGLPELRAIFAPLLNVEWPSSLPATMPACRSCTTRWCSAC